MQQLAADLVWLESTALANFIAVTPWAYPLISALHLFGIALLFGSMVPVDLRLLKVLGSQFDAVLQPLIRTALIGFAVAVPSGVWLASVRISEYLENPAFLAKLALLLLAGVNALALRLLAGPRGVVNMVGRLAGRIAATASLVLWIAAVLAGRWIAFV